uniref:folate gamma-glutamyl hydrolase n=3 Tax=Dunaliella tertiolecta TaxID=3047 RepID=A0A7S3VMD6_DUNTE|mmetsp:Transcript_12603/g.34458  ORF Transcript_12603/g.34458 Transcript_12603/m.34458 type:complete len:405 (-) Transcript_12603:726-1940(-)
MLKLPGFLAICFLVHSALCQQSGGARIHDDASSKIALVAAPLVGILTQPCERCLGKSLIPTAVIKWVEAAGGRPVLIRYYSSEGELRRLFQQVNGLVLPDGPGYELMDDSYMKAARSLFELAVQANDAGDPFPIYGICRGFQMLHTLASNVTAKSLLVDTKAGPHATNIKFWNKAAMQSKLFGNLLGRLQNALESEHIIFQDHKSGISPAIYDKYPSLSSWYRILSTSKDIDGDLITSIEGVKYPFFGTQWHPEMPPYEFYLEQIPHSSEAIQVSQHTGSVLVEAAKKSLHRPQSKEQELELVGLMSGAHVNVADEENASMTYFFDAKVKLDVRDDEMKEGPQRRLLQGNEPATKAQLDDVESKVRELRGLFGLYGLFGIFGVFGTLYEMKRKMTGYGEASPRV